MGFNDHIDEELSRRLDWLLENGVLESGSPAEGIARQVLAQGTGSMSDKQLAVYDRVIIPALEKYGSDIDEAT